MVGGNIFGKSFLYNSFESALHLWLMAGPSWLALLGGVVLERRQVQRLLPAQLCHHTPSGEPPPRQEKRELERRQVQWWLTTRHGHTINIFSTATSTALDSADERSGLSGLAPPRGRMRCRSRRSAGSPTRPCSSRSTASSATRSPRSPRSPGSPGGPCRPSSARRGRQPPQSNSCPHARHSHDANHDAHDDLIRLREGSWRRSRVEGRRIDGIDNDNGGICRGLGGSMSRRVGCQAGLFGWLIRGCTSREVGR